FLLVRPLIAFVFVEVESPASCAAWRLAVDGARARGSCSRTKRSAHPHWCSSRFVLRRRARVSLVHELLNAVEIAGVPQVDEPDEIGRDGAREGLQKQLRDLVDEARR